MAPKSSWNSIFSRLAQKRGETSLRTTSRRQFRFETAHWDTSSGKLNLLYGSISAVTLVDGLPPATSLYSWKQRKWIVEPQWSMNNIVALWNLIRFSERKIRENRSHNVKNNIEGKNKSSKNLNKYLRAIPQSCLGVQTVPISSWIQMLLRKKCFSPRLCVSSVGCL